MKLSSAALVLSLAGSILATNINSKPFQLMVLSDQKKYNGTVLDACHEGAGVEGLCPVKNSSPAPAYTNFTFTYPSTEDITKKYGPSGSIYFHLPVNGGNQTEKEGLGLYSDPSTNVAFIQFFPGNNFYEWAFDPQDRLNIQSYYNDTANPPTETTNATGYYRFYLCQVEYSAYDYVQLSFVYGKYPPQNPTCTAATVKRVFLS